MIQHALLAVPWKPIVSGGVDFDGTDRMARGADLTGNADSKTGILSVWAFQPAIATNEVILAGVTTVGGNTTRVGLVMSSTGDFSVNGRNAANTLILVISSSAGGYTGRWVHFLSSWDLSAGASHIYVDDVSDQTVTTRSNDTIEYTLADWGIGDTPGGAAAFSGALAEVYFAPGQFLDFSTESNRRKFITATKRPMNLGSDGATPTGSAPLIYQSIVVGGTVSGFATNKGGGGNFTITGTLASATSSPSG